MRPLTRREGQVLELIAVGKTTKEISVVLQISEATVSWHVAGASRRRHEKTWCP